MMRIAVVAIAAALIGGVVWYLYLRRAVVSREAFAQTPMERRVRAVGRIGALG